MPEAFAQRAHIAIGAQQLVHARLSAHADRSSSCSKVIELHIPGHLYCTLA